MASANPPFTRKGPRKSLSLSGAMNLRLMQEHSQQAFAAAAVKGGSDPSQPSADVLPLNNFYQLLHSSLPSSPVHLRIPETLILTEDGHDVLLCTRPDGCVTALPHCSFSHFADLCENHVQLRDLKDLSEFPVCVFFTANSHQKVFFSYAEARKHWMMSTDPLKLMQRYIPSASSVPLKLRLIWKNGVFSRYIIKKRGIEAFLKSVKLPKPIREKYVRNASCITPRLKQSQSCEEESVVSSKAEGELDWELLDIELVQAERFAGAVCRVLETGKKECVKELAYDVLQDSEEQFYLLNVKWAQMDITSIRNPRSQKLRQKFSEVMSSGHLGKIPFIDLSEVTANNVKLYMSQMANNGTPSPGRTLTPTSFAEACFKANLDAVGDKLDSLVRTVSTERQKHEEEQKVKLGSYPNANILDSIISKVYGQVTADPDLQEHFTGMGQHAIHMIKMGFTKAFLGVDNYYFKKTVKKAHEGMGITHKQFKRFIAIFTSVMEDEGVRSEDIALVCKHLSHFGDEVVETNR